MATKESPSNQATKESEKQIAQSGVLSPSIANSERLHRLRGVLGISESSPLPASFTNRVRKSFKHHTWQYWFIATLFNFLLALQIAIAATLTAIGNINNEKVRIAIVALGGINTFVAGLIAYLKSRNQPNRARQFRVDLRRVCDAIDDAEADFLYADLDEPTLKRIKDLRDLYLTARNDAEANYPDSWVTTALAGDGKQQKRVVLGPGITQSETSGSSPSKKPEETVAEASKKDNGDGKDTNKQAVERAKSEDSITPAAGPKVPPQYQSHGVQGQ